MKHTDYVVVAQASSEDPGSPAFICWQFIWVDCARKLVDFAAKLEERYENR